MYDKGKGKENVRRKDISEFEILRTNTIICYLLCVWSGRNLCFILW